MDLNNIVGFKAVDKNGNERQVTVDEMTELVSARIVSAASEISTFAAAAAAGTDEFEDQLPQSDTFSWLRTLDGSKNPTLTSSSAAAKVLGGLIGINNTWFRTRSQYKGSILQAPTGIYRPAPGVITDTLSGGGLILVFRMDDNNACVFQVTGNGILAVRTMNVNNGKWSDWDTIANPSFPT
ncbi:hypothetical protein LI113_21235 [Phocaeicola vulgatus]|uniref:hypothetical protein n=1 Tax=Phocaeicola vulgatus TaxID=821 RepID=UPI001D08B41D|nr:hypothetical protein [Phocaeicola vulgatus]MCB7021120.1 hypothetical protein [Phocaeicola vulgatus]